MLNMSMVSTVGMGEYGVVSMVGMMRMLNMASMLYAECVYFRE